MSLTRLISFHSLLLAGTLALAGCGVTSDHRPVVDRAMASHTVLFAPGQTELSGPENQVLGEFLATLAPTAVKDLSLHAGPADDVTDLRMGSVSMALRTQGFPGGKVVLFTGEEELGPDAMRLDITYAVAISDPKCPDWTRPGANYLNSTHTNFGCAYHRNLSAMVADPEDLEHGHGSNAISADRNALIIQRYRTGVDIVPPGASASTSPNTGAVSGSESGGESGAVEAAQ